MKRIFYLIVVLIVMNAGCIAKQEKLDLSIVKEQDIKEETSSIKAAIASVISPKESYIYYEEMIQYISKRLGGPVKIVQKRNYSEINRLIKNNSIDFAFVCSGAYIDGNSEFGMKLLVAAEVKGNTTYKSYIIVPKDSNDTTLLDLRGKKFAFSDPLSNSGKLYPTYRLALINETPDTFFGVDRKGRNNYFFTYSHDNSIIAVSEGLADGAAVDSLVYDYMKDTKPDIISKTKIIEISPPFGIPPVVVSKDMEPFLESRIRDIFLNMDKDEEGRAILSKVGIDRFDVIEDSAYNSVREMKERVR